MNETPGKLSRKGWCRSSRGNVAAFLGARAWFVTGVGEASLPFFPGNRRCQQQVGHSRPSLHFFSVGDPRTDLEMLSSHSVS